MYYKGYQAVAASVNITLNSSSFTPRDSEGHGSHTLSTAGGRIVPASLYGHANGTAKGGSPRARVASYKVCWPTTTIMLGGCQDSDILAAFDDAIHDGVDILSVSIGGATQNYHEDGIAIGAFHAITNGIPVICSAGNEGPKLGTVTNVAPWIFTVGASTMDRRFQSDVVLGNKKIYKGKSLAQYSLPGAKNFYPLINAADAKAPNSTIEDAHQCSNGSLDPIKVKGKIVVCHSQSPIAVEMGESVLLAGGVGMIAAIDEILGDKLTAEIHVLPATDISATDGVAVYSYINSTKSPKAYIQPVLTKFDLKPSPSMADFSSVGPNAVTPEILKPDITAPGVDILAAYTQSTSPTDLPFDMRRVPFFLLSGTSMSCPHVAGIVGLLKSLHRDWSPSAIRSAIMTSSQTRDNMDGPMKNASFSKATPFNYGAGHVRPNHAMDPGLVYDLTTQDYLNFLCASGYNSTLMLLFYGKPYSCPLKKLRLIDFNYPSITVPSLSRPTTVTRRVKNVGAPGTYKVRFSAPPNVSMIVKPDSLTFNKTGEEKVFEVTLAPKHSLKNDYAFGRLDWFDGVHNVRSPIVVKGP